MTDIGELRPTIKSAIMYEEMTGNDFISAEMNEMDMIQFMYCVYVCTVGRVSYDAFVGMLGNKRFATAISTQWKHYERFMGQFGKKKSEKKDDDGKTVAEMRISMREVAQLLVFKYGLDPNYVFNEVELWELDYLISIGERAYRENEEEKRLWVFFQLMPHLDPKKSRTLSPSKMFPFPWEENVHTKKGRESVLERETERAKATIGRHMDIEL